MKWLSYYKFKSNDIIIVFTKICTFPEENVSKYSFSVEGNKELTKQLLDFVEKNEVRKVDIPTYATNLFKIIEEKKLLDQKNISILINIYWKGGRYRKVTFTHQNEIITKKFILYSLKTHDILDDWEDIFFSNRQKNYADFLKQFEVKIPNKLFEKNVGPEFKFTLDKFKSKFNFKN